MSLDYIRKAYAVPAHRGAEVVYEGQTGVITGARGQYVRVRLLGEKHARNYHPTSLYYVEKKHG